MKGKIVNLQWIPGYNLHSSRGCKKDRIVKGMRNADYVSYNGYGNYSVVRYSKYIATFIFEDGTSKRFDIRKQIKDAFNISKMTESVREEIERLLPLNVDVDEYDVKFLRLNKLLDKLGR